MANTLDTYDPGPLDLRGQAEALIGTTQPSPGQATLHAMARKAWAYYDCEPYPQYAFGRDTFPSEDGPIPTPLPLPKIITDECAEFVFRGGPPAFSLPASEDGPDLSGAEQYLQRVIRDNRLGERWVPLAQACGTQGALAAKFSYDGDDPGCPVKVTFLSVPDQCRVWFDPHDWTRPLMARVQYPYRDPRSGDWYYYREEWTADSWVTYRPLRAGDAAASCAAALPGYGQTLGDRGADDGAAWEEAAREDNPFGVIPVTLIANARALGNPYGEGDLWRQYRLVDRIALTMHGEDAANQIHSDPIGVALNAALDNDGKLRPGEVMSLTTRDNDSNNSPHADFKLLEPSGAARPHVRAYADKMESLLYAAAGLSRVTPETVSNKGAMSSLVLRLLYQRTMATADRKRELWGNSGMCVFFRLLLLGLRNMNAVPALRDVPDDVVVSAAWPEYFPATDTDRLQVTERTILQMQDDLTSHEAAIRRVARVEGIPDSDVPALVKVLEAQLAQKQALAQATAGEGGGAAGGAKPDGQPPAEGGRQAPQGAIQAGAALQTADRNDFRMAEHGVPPERQAD